jgi:O-methyltransferase involved in polyketide biosynthesis
MIILQETKTKVNFSGISRTSLAPLCVRAKISKEYSSLFNDGKAIELFEQMDSDLFSFVKLNTTYFDFIIVARAMQLDNVVKAFITEHPHASVVNLGAGLETGFYRIDNSTIHWYDLDLPEVIEIRKQLLPETDRSTCIAKSVFDPSWCQDINTKGGVFMIAGGLLRYFRETQVRQLFSLIADRLPGSEIAFEAESKSSSVVDGNYGAYGVGWSDDDPEKRDALQAEALMTFKNMWIRTPQDKKDKMISALTTLTKPQSVEWNDFEMWWNQLSAQEKGKAMSDFYAGFFPDLKCGCPLEDANEIMVWDNRITVVDQFPLFKNISRNPSLSSSIRQFMDYTDENGRIKIFHMRV